MKKRILIPAILILLVVILVWAFLSHSRAGGEISFSARIDRVENGTAYALGWDLAVLLPEVSKPLSPGDGKQPCFDIRFSTEGGNRPYNIHKDFGSQIFRKGSIET